MHTLKGEYFHSLYNDCEFNCNVQKNLWFAIIIRTTAAVVDAHIFT